MNGGVYLAACFPRKWELREYAAEARAAGIAILSDWFDDPAMEESEVLTMRTDLALRCMRTVVKCDTLVVFTTDPRAKFYQRGGHHVELGLALAMGMRVIVVGARENIFHTLPMIEAYDTWPDALAALAKEAA